MARIEFVSNSIFELFTRRVILGSGFRVQGAGFRVPFSRFLRESLKDYLPNSVRFRPKKSDLSPYFFYSAEDEVKNAECFSNAKVRKVDKVDDRNLFRNPGMTQEQFNQHKDLYKELLKQYFLISRK